MRMMGMLDSAYHTSWFIFFLLNVLFVSLIVTIISLFIFKYSNILLMFVFYFLYGLSLFGYMMIFIAIFKEVKTGTPIFTIIHLILYYIRWTMPDGKTSYFVRTLSCFIPNLAVNNFSLVLWNLEEQKIGLHFSSLTTMMFNFWISTYYIVQFFNFFIYLAIGLYLTYTLPSEFGS